jgi:myo-inositol-1(or 4)-monophosphatase
MMVHDEERLSWLETAAEAARQAGQLLRELGRQPLQVNHKGFRDLVTDADIAAQQLITRLLHGRFPEHGFLGEEDDPALPASGPVIWVIDPIDGTSNFSRQQPNFSVSIAAAVPAAAGREAKAATRAHLASLSVQAGVVYDPMRDELFAAAAGLGCTLNGQPVWVSSVPDLAPAIVALDWGHTHENRRTVLGALNRFAHEVHSIRAIGSAALALAWVAGGRLDGYRQYALGPWDAAAGSLLVREAGGSVTTLAGQDWTPADAGCLASNGRIQERFRELAADIGLAQS